MPRAARSLGAGSQDPSRGPTPAVFSGKAAPRPQSMGKAAIWLPLRLKAV